MAGVRSSLNEHNEWKDIVFPEFHSYNYGWDTSCHTKVHGKKLWREGISPDDLAFRVRDPLDYMRCDVHTYSRWRNLSTTWKLSEDLEKLDEDGFPVGKARYRINRHIRRCVCHKLIIKNRTIIYVPNTLRRALKKYTKELESGDIEEQCTGLINAIIEFSFPYI